MKDFFNKIRFDLNADRLGPDLPFSHWRLFFQRSMLTLCKKRFKSFGKESYFRPGAFAVGCANIEIGNNVVIRTGTMLFGESREKRTMIKIEDKVLIGAGVHIYINNHKYDDLSKPIYDQGYYPDDPVCLKNGCWIGANSIILPGITVGRNSVVGAGSIVTKDIPDYTLVAGNPAKVIKK